MAFSTEDKILIKNLTTDRLHCYPFS